MNRSPATVVRKILRAFRRRLRAQACLHSLASVLLALALAALLAELLLLARGKTLELRHLPATAAIATAIGCVAAGASALFRFSDLQHVARLADAAGQTRDRLLTALTFSRDPQRSPFAEAALRECAQNLKTRRLPRLVRLKAPSRLGYVLAPLASIAFLHWHHGLSAQVREDTVAEAQAEVAETVSELKALASDLEKRREFEKDEEHRQLAEQMRERAKTLHVNATEKEAAQKAALRELSALEQLVQQMQQQPHQLVPDELKQLAAALEKNTAAREVAAALQSGDHAEAARKIEELAARNDQSAEQAAAALRDALEQLEQKRQLSQQLQRLAQELEQLQKENGSAKNALQRLAQLLQGMQRQAQPGGSGSKSTQQTLQNVLAALQNMKAGDAAPRGGRKDAPEGAPEGGPVAIQAFNSGRPDAASLPTGANMPAGRPGTEDEAVTTANAVGTPKEPGGAKGAEIAVTGQLGEGESLSALVPTAGDDSNASRRYKELYEAMAPAAQDAVLQEEIPLGSRFLIKRYFEAIRPRE